MKVVLLAKPIAAIAISLSSTVGFVLLSHSHHQQSSLKSKTHIHSVANNRSFIVWLHGLGSSGPAVANGPIKSHFTSPEFKNTVRSFPSAPSKPVTCYHGFVMPSWFDIHQLPMTATPILWSHGMADRIVLFEAGQVGPPFLVEVGVSCGFKAYPGLGHSIINKELRYLESWIKTCISGSS